MVTYPARSPQTWLFLCVPHCAQKSVRCTCQHAAGVQRTSCCVAAAVAAVVAASFPSTNQSEAPLRPNLLVQGSEIPLGVNETFIPAETDLYVWSFVQARAGRCFVHFEQDPERNMHIVKNIPAVLPFE